MSFWLKTDTALLIYLLLYIYLLLFFMPWYFIPKVLKLAKAKMYVRNRYDGDSENVNVLARHTPLNAELPLK